MTRVICGQNDKIQIDKSGTISVRRIDFQFCYREQKIKMPEHCHICSLFIALKTTVNKASRMAPSVATKWIFSVFFDQKSSQKCKQNKILSFET